MKSAGKLTLKCCILSYLVLNLLMVFGWSVFAQEEKAPDSSSVPVLAAGMEDNTAAYRRWEVVESESNS